MKNKIDVHTIFRSEGAGSYIYHHSSNRLIHWSGASQEMTVNELFRKMQFDKLFCEHEGIPYIVQQKIPSHIERDKLKERKLLKNKGEDNA